MKALEKLASGPLHLAQQVHAQLGQTAATLQEQLDLPQRQRFLELLGRGFDTFVHGLVRATRTNKDKPQPPKMVKPVKSTTTVVGTASSGAIMLGPRPVVAEVACAGEAKDGSGDESDDVGTVSAAQRADDEAFAQKFAQLFLDLGGIFPKLAQVLSLRPDVIKNPIVLKRLRAVQEECKQMPFKDAVALATAESTAFREGRFELKDWPQHVHAGSIAQVAPFVIHDLPRESGTSADPVTVDKGEDNLPDGVVKLAFVQMRKVMEVDFRLLRSQLKWMERGQWASALPGLGALNSKQAQKIKEVFKLMVNTEAEVLQEFDLRHEAECQIRGDEVIQSLVSPANKCVWLEEWRDGAIGASLRPAGTTAVAQARDVWRSGGVAGAWLKHVACRAYGGKELAEDVARGETHVARLRVAIKCLQVRVPKVYAEASGPHVLSMSLAGGRSLKQVLDVASARRGDEAEKAAAWFAALLLFVIVPLWGKMLLVLGCCHADPHPGNFKVDGIPGLDILDDEELAASQPPPKRGLLSRFLCCGGARNQTVEPAPSLTLWVLDWGSCVDLRRDVRSNLCALLVSLGDLRDAQSRLKVDANDAVAGEAMAKATAEAAACIRSLGMQASDEKDAFLAAIGMALFDPSTVKGNPILKGQKLDDIGSSFAADSGIGKVLRVIAILVGMCRELETQVNQEVAGHAPAGGQTADHDRRFVELFLVDLWRPFAEAGLAK
eukprot:TRINITY_DN43505_c0_g1_i1.p1 TRINITY_DN43505_c0_g1~~TRINITY_DN43505_c0_g1_i1.p1  ORF type:complete len:722 (-),score=121.56 TRINITY_DN43505_c0_g1_i1:187-2352(-)